MSVYLVLRTYESKVGDALGPFPDMKAAHDFDVAMPALDVHWMVDISTAMTPEEWIARRERDAARFAANEAPKRPKLYGAS